MVALKAQNCISSLKQIYPGVGLLYGHLSSFVHWGQVVHHEFLSVAEEGAGVLRASVRHRAIALAYCLVLLDILTHVISNIYGDRSEYLVLAIQGTATRDARRKSRLLMSEISEFAKSEDFSEILSLMIER